MKKILIGMMVMLSGAMVLAAEQNDFRLTFSTKGKDVYSAEPKTTILDGEFYALVWSETANTPIVFNADGTIKGEAELVAAGPWAKDGKCGYVLHTIPAAEMQRYAGGVFSLVALDTRKADGTLSGYERDASGAARPRMVNGYFTICSIACDAARLSSVLDIDSPISISETSAVPEGTPKPEITGMKMRKGAKGMEMVLKVKGTSAYLNYTATSVGLCGEENGAQVEGVTATTGAANPNDEVEIVVPATEKMQLFKVNRK